MKIKERRRGRTKNTLILLSVSPSSDSDAGRKGSKEEGGREGRRKGRNDKHLITHTHTSLPNRSTRTRPVC